jgi:Thaumatin family
MKMLNLNVGSLSLVFLLGMSCSSGDATPPGTGATGGSGGATLTGGAAGTGGATAGASGTGGQAGTTAGSGGAAGMGGATAGSGGAAGTGAMSGGSGMGGSGGSGGYPPDATVVDTGVVIDGSPKDVVASDTQLSGGCCKQIELSQCRFTVGASYRTCWACEPGCYDSLKPPTPVEPITKCNCDGRPAGQRCVKVENRCSEMIRAKVPNNGTKDLQPGDCVTTFTNAGFRIEGYTGCVGNTCDPIPHTLVEMNLGNTDWYDLSHVDGANLPLGFYLVKGSFTPPTTQNECNCLDRECRIDIKNTTCIERNKLRDKNGKVFACAAECRVDPAGNPDHDVACCVNGASVPDKCLPTEPAIQRDYQMFRFPCPQVYSYPYDEMHEVDQNYVLCTCSAHPDYDAIFCP